MNLNWNQLIVFTESEYEPNSSVHSPGLVALEDEPVSQALHSYKAANAFAEHAGLEGLPVRYKHDRLVKFTGKHVDHLRDHLVNNGWRQTAHEHTPYHSAYELTKMHGFGGLRRNHRVVIRGPHVGTSSQGLYYDRT